jgi:hypothetical protein
MKTISKRKFNQLVSDFEYGIIDSYTIGDSTITWQPADQTCFEFVGGKVVATGSFEHLLEWFLEEEKDTAE